MVKTIVAVVIALILLNAVWFVLKIAVLVWAETREEKKWSMGPVYQSEAREAFIMEYSQKDIKGKRFSYGGCVRFHERQTYGNINRSCNLFCREKCGCIPQSVYDIL